MTPEEGIDLITPKANEQPRSRRSALLSLDAAAATSLFDLTADTPSPVSARGIVNDDNDHSGGNVRHDSDRPHDLPRIPGTRVHARSNTSHALAPVTNLSSSPPRKKKSRSSPRRYNGKENSSSDISVYGSTPVENRKSSFLFRNLPSQGSNSYALLLNRPRLVPNLA